MTMRSLTLTQPWCGLVASGIKLDENRPRSMIRREEFGKPFALHASREIDGDVEARLRQIAPEIFGDYAAMTDDGIVSSKPTWCRLGSIRSAIIAVATIEDVHDLRMPSGRAWVAELPPDRRRFVFGPVVYSLRDILVLPEPVPCRGWQGFWTVTPDIETRVVEQIARAA